MKKYLFISVFIFILPLILNAEEVVLKQYLKSDPVKVQMPYMVEDLDVNGKKFDENNLLKTPVSFSLINKNQPFNASGDDYIEIGGDIDPYSIVLLSFYIDSDRFCKGKLSVDGEYSAELYIDGKKSNSVKSNQMRLEPRKYEIILKCLVKNGDVSKLKVSLSCDDEDALVALSADPIRRYTVNDVLEGKRVESASLSADGKYILISYSEVFPGGKRITYSKVKDLRSGEVIFDNPDEATTPMRWMPKNTLLYFTRQGMSGKELLTLDPVTKKESLLVEDLPDGAFRFADTESFLLFTISDRGPVENKDIKQILDPADRQQGWRNRSFIYRYDLSDKVLERLTFGHTSTYLNDISSDGRYIIFSVRHSDLTEHPFSTTSLYKMDLHTREVVTIFEKEKFLNSAQFSSDGKSLMITGSPGAFGGIGEKIGPDQIANSGDSQLFLYNIESGDVKPLTKDFDPSIDRAIWNRFDNMIYAQAKQRDRVLLYRIDPVKGSIEELKTEEDVLSGVSLASGANVMAYWGAGESNAVRLYAYDLKKKSGRLLEDSSAEIMKDIKLGDVEDWTFENTNGDTIYGRYYLPPSFDPSKKYPMIVFYYGGTTPTARVMEGRYPHHVYAGLGYVCYIVQPSGATGFGQEFSARHVNTWGMRTAEDIIEGTIAFSEEHSFIDKDKIGCIGASYGGFMSMYLQTRTDIFATAISHAGISDITSYWGEGYWGYSYSAQATATNYPWNAPEIYVGQSPLFNADKINTPILLLHGGDDTNVPVGESIQMFTALKILGKEAAFVVVPGQDHHIIDYDKRFLWSNTIFAWFAKYLQDRPEWWNDLYPEKNL